MKYWIVVSITGLVSVGAFLWFFRGSTYVECWAGYDCGDAGGWLSAIATFAAVFVALRQSHFDKLARDKSNIEKCAGIASALMTDVQAVAQNCVAAINELVEMSGKDVTILSFRLRFQFSEYDAILSMRPNFVNLNYLAVISLSQMLRLMDNKNKATKRMLDRGIDERGNSVNALQVIYSENIAYELATYTDILDTCIDSIKLLGNEIAPRQKAAVDQARRLSSNWNDTKIKSINVINVIHAPTAKAT